MIVVWRVTEHCNLSCKFCAYDREVQRSRRETDSAEVERLGNVLAEYQFATGDPVMVSWLGGEPFLWQALPKLTELFVRDFHLRISATTNGTTLSSQAIREHILAYYSELTVSIDGLGAVHEQLRGWPGGFARLRDGLARLVQGKLESGSTLKLRVNVVLLRETIAEFSHLCRELATWGVNEITFNQLGGRDRPEFFPANRLLPQQVESLAAQLPELRKRLATGGVILRGGNDYIARFRASARDQALRVEDCHAGVNQLFIDEQGHVAPCHFTTDNYSVSTRELRTSDDIVSLKTRFAESRQMNRAPACDDCHSTKVFEKFVHT